MCKLCLFSLAITCLIFCSASQAQAPAGALIDTPVYDPQAGRYFALISAPPDPGQYQGATWISAGQHARQHNYKGVAGRLAIVDSIEVHEFLLRTFRPQSFQNIWIGLRYMCGLRKAEWSDGTELKPGGFQAWDKRWNQDPTAACVKSADANVNLRDWAPVAYSPEHTWIVKGQKKVYQWYFIEYPTGHP